MAQSSGKSGIATLLGFRGDKPKVPPWVDIKLEEEQLKSIAANIKALPEAEKLAAGFNEFQTKAFLERLSQLGMSGIWETGLENIERGVMGQLPRGVEDYLARKGAERGFARGTSTTGGTSEFDVADNLRHYGLNQLAFIDKSMNTFQHWMQQASSQAPLLDLRESFINPMQKFATKMQNQQQAWNVKWLHNQIAAMPSNEEQAYAQMFDYVADWATVAAGYGTRTMMGGAGGGAMGGASDGQALIDSSGYAYQPPAYQPGGYGGYGGYGGTMQPGGWGVP